MSLDPQQLAALAAVLRLGSFDAAAAQLSVTPSAISQRIKALEERVGTTLVHRGQPCTGTEAGSRLARHADDIALLEARTLAGLAPAASLPRIRLAVPADVLSTWLIPALAAVPDTLFDIVLDDQDTADDWLRRGEVSAAITGHARAAPGCDVSPLGAMRYVATASPAFIARWFTDGVTAQALSRAPMLVFNLKDRLQARWLRGRTGTALTPPIHLLPSSNGFVDAAIAGLGWGMNPEILVRDAMASGHLLALVEDAPLDVPIHWQQSRILAPALAPLRAEIRRVASRRLGRLEKKPIISETSRRSDA